MLDNLNKRKYGGFTILEVLMALLIISIIVSIVIVAIRSARLKARDARRISDLQQVRIALEQYFSVTKRYPNSSNSGYCELATQLQPYLQVLPRDPSDPAATCTATAGYAYFTERVLQPQEWLLRVATFELPNSVRGALQEDIDGTSIAPASSQWIGGVAAPVATHNCTAAGCPAAIQCGTAPEDTPATAVYCTRSN